MKKFKNKKKILIIGLISLMFFSLNSSVYCDSDDYELGFEDESEIVWRVNEVDEDQLEYILESSDLDDSILDYDEDTKIKFEISDIDEVTDDYYLITYGQYEDDDYVGTGQQYIAMDPGDMAHDWEDFELDDYSIMFILTETDEYLDEFGDDISETYGDLISTTSSSIILNASIGSFYFWLKMTYDERAILDELSLVYDGIEIFNLEQRSYTPSNEPEIILMIVVLILIFGVLGVVIVVIVLSVKSRKKRKLAATPAVKPQPVYKEQIPKSEIKEPIEATLFCQSCGSKRERDALFCTYCGNKF